MKTKLYFFVIITASFFVLTCKKEEKGPIPELTTSDVSYITLTNANCGGEVTRTYNIKISARGVCWSENDNPTIKDKKTIEKGELGKFSTMLKDLKPNTAYYVRAYATNENGTGYGNTVLFNTLEKAQEPQVETSDIIFRSDTSVNSGGSLIFSGGDTVTSAGVCWSTGSLPVITDNKKVGEMVSMKFKCTVTGLIPGVKYYLRAFATNNVGTGYGPVKSFIAGTTQDIEMNTYNTVKIGTQTWMKENLRTTKYNDGTPIPETRDTSDREDWVPYDLVAYCWNNLDSAKYSKYGAFYTWNVVNTGKLCPVGWHVPSDDEWTTLTDFLIKNNYGLSYDSLGIAKSVAAKEGWVKSSFSDSPGDIPLLNNSSGFSAVPVGIRNFKGKMGTFGYSAIFWTSTFNAVHDARCRMIIYNQKYMERSSGYSSEGYSVRCVLDK